MRKTLTYNKQGLRELGRSIAAKDICVIKKEIEDNLLIEISYPTASGMRTAYIKSLENFSKNF